MINCFSYIGILISEFSIAHKPIHYFCDIEKYLKYQVIKLTELPKSIP